MEDVHFNAEGNKIIAQNFLKNSRYQQIWHGTLAEFFEIPATLLANSKHSFIDFPLDRPKANLH